MSKIHGFMNANLALPTLGAVPFPAGCIPKPLSVVETDPGVRGDTATGGSKPAKLETGAMVRVPLFINEGEVLKIDTGHIVAFGEGISYQVNKVGGWKSTPFLRNGSMLSKSSCLRSAARSAADRPAGASAGLVTLCRNWPQGCLPRI